METPDKAPDRLTVLEKIKQLEKQGMFDKDIEIDPPFKPLNPDKIDFVKKKLSSKIKAKFANYIGRKFFESMIKNKSVIFAGVNGLDNLKGYEEESAIITCNHINIFDSFAVLLGLEKHFKNLRLYKIVREGNYAFKGKVGMILRNCDTLPIGESRVLLSKCSNAIGTLLSKGKKILIYPEQSMWWNYKKPRPLKKGAFLFAAKFKSPIIPCFITLKDSELIGPDGFPVQEFTLNVLPTIKFDQNRSTKENCERMMKENEELWKQTYESVYSKILEYNIKK